MLKRDKSFSNCGNRNCNEMKGQQMNGLSGNKFADSGKYNSTKMLKPKDFGKNITYSLHHFFDASEAGYGQASYLRMENENGDIHCCLIFGK